MAPSQGAPRTLVTYALAPVVGSLSLLRRRWPLGALLASAASLQVYNLLDTPGIFAAVPLSVTLAAAWASGHRLVPLALAVWFGASPVVFALVADLPEAMRTLILEGAIPDAALLASVLLLGEAIRSRRRLARAHDLLLAEQDRSEALLLNVLPATIADRLKQGEKVIADQFDDVTVMFADLVGFTQASQQVHPDELVGTLDELFSTFDRLAELHGLEKIKTIGDAYMVAGGLPEPRPDHAEAVADMALELRRAVSERVDPAGRPMHVRIGIDRSRGRRGDRKTQVRLRPVGGHRQHRQPHGVQRRAGADPGHRTHLPPAARLVRLRTARLGRSEREGDHGDVVPAEEIRAHDPGRELGEGTMPMAIDPVCGMRIDTDDAVARADFEGTTYYFCSRACFEAFVADQGLYATGPETERLDAEELARRGFSTVEEVDRLVELGVVEPTDGEFTREDVMRVRVVGQLQAAGIELEALAAALRSGHLTLGYMQASARMHPRSSATFAELAEEMGVDFESLVRLYLAMGLPAPRPEERAPEEDRQALGGLAVLFEAGVEADDVVALARLWGDSVRKIAQYLPHYFHIAVEERYRRRGLADNQAYEEALRKVGLRIGRSGEDFLGWLFRRHTDLFSVAHQFEHVETALEQAGVRPRSPRGIEAAVFADVSGFTALTERSGDRAADVALTLAEVAAEVAARHGGEVVEMLGDGVLLHVGDPSGAVMAALEIVAGAEARGLPPTHVGVEAGTMLYEGGDYFGRTVNLAARIASEAGPGQVLAGEGVAAHARSPGFRLTELRRFRLKGITGEVAIFEVTSSQEPVDAGGG